MTRFYYDLHIHSCLSPCGDNDMTPNNIANMAALAELDIVALTDHNTLQNCPAFFKAAENAGIIAIAGCEVTTSEEIHAVCLFENLETAMQFEEKLKENRTPIENRPEIFGDQLVLDSEDNLIKTEPNLLIMATLLSLQEVKELAEGFGGICYPAHIDRSSNSIISVLGDFSADYGFKLCGLHDINKKAELTERFPVLKNVKMLVSSDAHYLENIRDKEFYVELDCDKSNPELVVKRLFEFLRKEMP